MDYEEEPGLSLALLKVVPRTMKTPYGAHILIYTSLYWFFSTPSLQIPTLLELGPQEAVEPLMEERDN